MKKFIILSVISVVLFACGGSSFKSTTPLDSNVVTKKDSVKVIVPVDTTKKAMVDTTKK